MRDEDQLQAGFKSATLFVPQCSECWTTELTMIEFIRNGTIVMMGMTVMVAGVFVVMYG